MKMLITIIAVLSSAFLFYEGQKSRNEVSTLRIENTDLADTLDARSKQLEKRNKEYESLATSYATIKEELDKATTQVADTYAPEPDVTDPVPDATPQPKAPTPPLEARLTNLKGIYDTAKAELDRKKGILDTNLQKARDTYQNLQNNLPEFKEQGFRRDSFGNVIGAKGVRTSDADRARAMEKHNAELQQWQSYIATAEAAQDQLYNDYRTLEENYRKAVSEAKKIK